MPQSLLKLVDKSPHHLAFAKLNPKKPTPAMIMGNLTDHLLFGTEFAYEVGPWENYKKKDAQEWREERTANGIVCFLRKEVDEVQEIIAAIRAHPEVQNIMSAGRSQVALTGETELEGTKLYLKGLLDWVADDVFCIADLKTTEDASPIEFGRHVVNMGYDAQAAYYTDLWKLNTGEDIPFVWIVAEVEPPYGVAVYRATPEALERGRKINQARLKRWARATLEPSLPGYPETVQDIQLPSWALPKEQ